jgi:indolepyruvate ferredoxin oxidoreductase beta subunit
MLNQSRPITMAVLAMGGEGGGVLADWCIDMAEHSNYWAQTTSVPGVAQRTGATVYYLEFFSNDGSNKEPILSTMPTPGEVDIVIASELMEAGRAVFRGFVTPETTTFIASTNRVYSMTEKTAMGDGRVSSEELLSACEAAAKKFISGDFSDVADKSGTVISAALFGALAGSGALPFTKEQFTSAVERSGVGVKNSLIAFEKSFEIAQNSLKPKTKSSINSNYIDSNMQALTACTKSVLSKLTSTFSSVLTITMDGYFFMTSNHSILHHMSNNKMVKLNDIFKLLQLPRAVSWDQRIFLIICGKMS